MIHSFPECTKFEAEGLADPFRYSPHPLVMEAAERVIAMIDGMKSDGCTPEAITKGFSEGKMIGILVCRSHQEGKLGYICAFSGSIGGQSRIEGFVPPIFDLTDPSGHFRKREAEITELNREITEISSSEAVLNLKEKIQEMQEEMDKELLEAKERMAEAKARRNRLRSECTDTTIVDSLTRESQHEKAEFRRLKASWSEKIATAREKLKKYSDKIYAMKAQRAEMSDALQEWIFNQYIVHNATGETSTISDIFGADGLTAPGGTGDCAAPKLLEYAFRHKLEPLAMGEFWYGSSPQTAVRTHGHFYPSCTSKCGPLLKFMLRGLKITPSDQNIPSTEPSLIYEDSSLIIIDKPSGMPSVPGLDGRESLFEWINKNICLVHQVHRLDMDTSGVIVFCKTEKAAGFLQRQFEERNVSKIYRARLSAKKNKGTYSTPNPVQNRAEGRISIPLDADYDERPRQKADFINGKEAITEYKILSSNTDGTVDIHFYPQTGRTHQLRVHSAHILGLGRPILGDMLYGAPETASRLHLHAESITFTHPESQERVTFTSMINCFR